MTEPERGVHDVGGLPGDPVDTRDHALTLYEKRVDALVVLLTSPPIGAFASDALRRAVEQNSAEDYARLGYYDKWLRGVRDLLIERGVLSAAEIDDRIEQIRRRGTERATS